MWERWLSGRKRTTRNRLIAQTIRGFESHPLRLFNKLCLVKERKLINELLNNYY